MKNQIEWFLLVVIEVFTDRLMILMLLDAWTMGAGDPISGTSTLMEISRNFGTMLNEGWKPRRTIVICSWDAEEYGLIGKEFRIWNLTDSKDLLSLWRNITKH